jgi:hypothetical protein
VLPLKPGATTVHAAGICTDGLFCGTPLSSGGDRSLADFESMAVDPTGHIEVVIPANADGKTTENWFYKQTGGPLMPPGAVNGNGTGNQTWVVAAAASSSPTAAPGGATVPNAVTAALPNTSAPAIRGGVAGGLLGLAGVALLVVARRRRRRTF